MANAVKGSWWVGENLTNQNSFRISNFFSNNAPSGYQAVQAGSDTDAKAFAASLSSGKPTPSLHDINWQIVGGPYATEAEANAAIPGIQSKTPAPGELAQSPLGGIAGVADAIAKLAGTIKGIFDALSDWRMWASLGWILLGSLLVGVALFKLMHGAQIVEQGAGEVLKGFVK